MSLSPPPGRASSSRCWTGDGHPATCTGSTGPTCPGPSPRSRSSARAGCGRTRTGSTRPCSTRASRGPRPGPAPVPRDPRPLDVRDHPARVRRRPPLGAADSRCRRRTDVARPRGRGGHPHAGRRRRRASRPTGHGGRLPVRRAPAAAARRRVRRRARRGGDAHAGCPGAATCTSGSSPSCSARARCPPCRPATLEAPRRAGAGGARRPEPQPRSAPELAGAPRRRHRGGQHPAGRAAAGGPPGVPPLLEYKRLARLHRANGWDWRRHWVAEGRFRPDYVVGGVVTGRWATRGGGALQLPKQIRSAVVADPGWRARRRRRGAARAAGARRPGARRAMAEAPGRATSTRHRRQRRRRDQGEREGRHARRAVRRDERRGRAGSCRASRAASRGAGAGRAGGAGGGARARCHACSAESPPPVRGGGRRARTAPARRRTSGCCGSPGRWRATGAASPGTSSCRARRRSGRSAGWRTCAPALGDRRGEGRRPTSSTSSTTR